MRPPVALIVTTMCLAAPALAIYTHSTWADQEATATADVPAENEFHPSSGFKLRTPTFAIQPKGWFDVEKETAHWNEVNARMKVVLNSKVDDSSVDPGKPNYSNILQKDVSVADKLNREVQKLNANIQAESFAPVMESDSGFSLIQLHGVTPTVTAAELLDSNVTTLSDWTYCTCGAGVNGTLANPERNWPGVELPVPRQIDIRPPSSLLQVTVQGRRLAVRKADVCSCENPWDGFKDPSGSTQCSLNSGVTVCLVRVNKDNGTKTQAEVNEEARQLLRAIDAHFVPTVGATSTDSVNTTTASALLSNSASNSSFIEVGQPDSFVEIWKPFRFQL